MRTINTASTDIGPDDAKQMLASYPYERQRPLKRGTVEQYARMMRAGEWIPGKVIEVAYVKEPTGSYTGYLINGQHRLHAVIASGATINFTIVHLECKDMEEVGLIYATTDTQTPRTVEDWIRAAGLSAQFDMTNDDVRVISSASQWIANGFRDSHAKRPGPIERTRMLLDWVEPGRTYLNYLSGGFGKLTRQARRAPLMSVGMVIAGEAIKVYGADLVEDFWRKIVTDDGLVVGDPRKLIVRELYSITDGRSSSKKGLTSAQLSRGVALSWNAFSDNRSLRNWSFPKEVGPFAINGTHYTGQKEEEG